MNTEIVVPERNNDGLAAVEVAQRMQILTNADYMDADAFCVGLKKLEKQVDKMFDEHVSRAYEAHKALVAKKKSFSEPIIEARKIAKFKMNVFAEQKEKERRAKEEQLQREAKKRAEEEALQAAIQAENDGDSEAAKAIIEQPVYVPPVSLASDTPKAKTSTRKVRKFKIINATIIPRQYLIPDEVAIGEVVRALGENSNIPGILVWEENC